MADIQFNFKAKDLEQIQKILDQMVAATAQIKANIGSPQSKEAAKEMAAEAKRARVELDKQSKILESQKGIIGGLQAEIKKWKTEMVKATDPAGIKKAQDEIAKLNGKLIDAKGSTNQWSKALGSFQFKFNALGNIAANVLSKMTQQAKQFIVEGIKMAAVAEGVSNAFNKIADGKYLDKLRVATRGAVSDLSLMKAAVQANNFKIPLEQLAVFLQFAGDRAISTGEDFDFLVDSIVKGLGRKSVLILDNLGLSVAEINKEVAKTGDFMSGAANVIEREMKVAGDVIDTNATKIAELRAAYQNMQVDFGAWLLDSSGLVNSYKRAADIEEADLSGIRKFWLAWIRYSDAPIEKYKAQIKELKDEQNLLFNQIAAFKEENPIWEPEELIKEKQTIVSLTTEIENLTAEKKLLGVEDRARLIEINGQIKKNQDLIDILTNLGNVIDKIPEIPPLDPKDYIGDLKNAVGEYLNIFNKAGLFAGIDAASDELAANDEARIEKREGSMKDFFDWVADVGKKADDEEENRKAEKEKRIQAITQSTANLAFSLTDLMLAKNTSAMNAELIAAEGNEKRQDEIRKKYAKKEQAISISQAIIAGAESVANVWSKWAAVPPVAAALSALALATVGIQIATIKAQKFAKGGEIDYGRLHSEGGTLIEAEKGEYVINRKSTSKYKGLIEGINQDDQMKILASLHMDRRVEGGFKQDEYTKKLYELMKDKEVGYETPEFFVIHKGTKTIKLKKH